MNRSTSATVIAVLIAIMVVLMDVAGVFAAESTGDLRIVRQNNINGVQFVHLADNDRNYGSVYQIDSYACGFEVFEDMFIGIDSMTVTADDHIIWHAVEYDAQMECRANNVSIDESNYVEVTYTYTLNSNIDTSDFITRFADDIVESNATSVTITTDAQQHMFILTYNAVTNQTPHIPTDAQQYTVYMPIVSN